MHPVNFLTSLLLRLVYSGAFEGEIYKRKDYNSKLLRDTDLVLGYLLSTEGLSAPTGKTSEKAISKMSAAMVPPSLQCWTILTAAV